MKDERGSEKKRGEKVYVKDREKRKSRFHVHRARTADICTCPEK